MSFVWNYFTKVDPKNARCNLKPCTALIAFNKSTSSMIYHLKMKHKIVPSQQNQETSEDAVSCEVQPQPETSKNPHKRQRTLLDFVKTRTLEEEVSRMVAVSNLSFNQISKTDFISESLAKKFPGRIIPKTNKTVSRMLMTFYKIAEEYTIQKIKSLKLDDQKFSATLDEWTSVSNQRYLNINVHYSVDQCSTNYINLGLVSIVGSCTAEKMAELVIFSFQFLSI